MNNAKFDPIKTLADQGLWHIVEQTMEYLNFETVENCRKVSEFWNESLKRISLVKYLQEFGESILGWPKAVKTYGARSSIGDLQEVKDSLEKLVEDGKCCNDPVHRAAKNGAVKLFELLLKTSCDLNARDDYGWTAFHWACFNGRIEIVQVLISSSKDFSIDLNARNGYGETAFHSACIQGRTEIVQFMMKNWREFNIDIKARNNDNETPLDQGYYGFGKHHQITKMLETEYSKIDVSESVQNLKLE